MNNIEKNNLNNYNSLEKHEKNFNIYKKEKFTSWEARQYVDKLSKNFKDYYSSMGYKEEKPVKISSGIDPTVRFIGSQISVLKPYIIEKRIPYPGVYIQQNCLRTRNVDILLDDNFEIEWGSYFPNMGAISPPDRIKESAIEAFDFFKKKLGILSENILIYINSKDDDLMDACKEYYDEKNLIIDSESQEYYRNKLGIDNVRGRYCNIFLKNSNGVGFSEVGNLIVIEDNNSKLCFEVSIGISTTLKQLHGLDHVQDCMPITGLESIDGRTRRKFEDSIITSSVLFHEGLRPLGQHNRNRILKKYVQALSYFRIKCGIQADDLRNIIIEFEEREFPETDKRISTVLIDFMIAFENELLHKKNLTQDQYKIKQALLLK